MYPFEWLGNSRASLPKVKTGCITCKKRRVKCDEGRPICNRCQKGNRLCAYQSQRTQLSEDTPMQIRLRYPAARSPLSKQSFSSEGERCGFDSFRQIPAGVLGGGLGWPDWGRVVLQISENDAALRHTVIALGAMHEDSLQSFRTSKIDDQRLLPVAYQQYHQAIKMLRSRLLHEADISVEGTILACMLLIVFDFMQGDYCAAGIHLSGGVALLRRYMKQHNATDALIYRISTPWRTSLERSGILPTEGSFIARVLLSYGYIDFWASCWMDSLPALPEVSVLEGLAVKPTSNLRSELNACIQTFTALENRIREFLRAARGIVYQHGQQVPPTDSRRQLPFQSSSITFKEMKTSLTDLLRDWNKTYCRVCTDHLYNGPQEIQAIDSVAANYEKIKTMLEAAQSDGTVDYQASTPDFRQILTLSKKVFEAKDFPGTSPFYVGSPFAFPFGIIHPLYITALHCIDPSVCQEALDILTSRHWKEGAWDSLVMGNIAGEQLAARQVIFPSISMPCSTIPMNEPITTISDAGTRMQPHSY
jgi:hypothetical protein